MSSSGGRASLYRKEALANLETPDAVNGTVTVIGGGFWLAIGSIAFLILVALQWSLWGRIPTYVHATGVIGSGFDTARLVVAPASGILHSYDVHVGDPVRVGEEIAQVELLDQMLAEANAEHTMDYFQTEKALKKAFWQHYIMVEEKNLDIEQHYLEDEVSRETEAVRGSEALLADEQRLLTRGLATRPAVQQAVTQLQQLIGTLDQKQVAIFGLVAKKIDLGRQRDDDLSHLDEQLLQARLKYQDAQNHLQKEGQIISNLNGVVVEEQVQLNGSLQPGTPVLAVAKNNTPLEGLFYVDPRQGRRVEPGMQVNVAPSTVETERYGGIVGHVEWVSDSMASEASMMVKLGNLSLVKLLQQNSAPLALKVRFDRDPSTYSGFKWSSSRGPHLKILPDTIAEAEVVIRQEPPITLVIPALRRFFGLQ